MKFNLKKIGSRLKGKGHDVWAREKQKAAGFVYIFGKNPIGRQAIKLDMKRQWYRHIDKAIKGKATSRDEKHWKRMIRIFKKEVVGIPSQETLELFNWLKVFQKHVKSEQITKEDLETWLPKFREYMESCEKNAVENYIAKEKLVEV